MQAVSCFSNSDPIQLSRPKLLNVKISPFSLLGNQEIDDEMDFSLQRKQAKISSFEKVDFFFTPRKFSAETPLKKTGFKRRLLFEGDEEVRGELSLTPIKAKRTYSESTLVQKQISDNQKYLRIQRRLVDQGVGKGSGTLSLQTIPNLENPDMATIESKTLNRILEERNDIILIDARFSFEYEAGHIENSLNINNPFHLETLFFEYGHLLFSRNFLKKLPELGKVPKHSFDSWLKAQNEDPLNSENLLDAPPVIVVHCEFSQKRGPKLLRYLRKRDREINEDFYPHLIYPHTYLLSGGYSTFVKEFPIKCTENGGYISMFNEKFKLECSFENSTYNKVWNEAKNVKFITNFY